MPDPFTVVAPRQQAFEWLRLGEVKPAGWMRRQMARDLEEGFLGHLDELVPSLIREDDIYGRDRLTRKSKHKDLGTVATNATEQVQYMWWNSETQSNWWDGLVRTALLLDHEPTLMKVRAYLDRVLATQDVDGYLGIYAPDLRYSFQGENGELWAQATLFRALLGYYEATGEGRVLEAVEGAARVTMAAYPAGCSQPFPAETSVCGDSHGLALTDALERLSQVTANDEYARYAAFLYAAYSVSGVSEDDAQYRHLVDPAYRFRGHGVHTYEHLRSLLIAAWATGNPALAEALDGYLDKLAGCLAPSGGPIGDEHIGGRAAEASETGYEYCSIHELLDGYTHLLQKTGAGTWGDRAEWLLFNAGQGARHPAGLGLNYLRTDNSASLTGSLYRWGPHTEHGPQTRYKFSPAHQDAAVCCAPNAGRIYPYYVRAMWMRSPAGLAATLYGPCEVRTVVNGVAVRIAEETGYPFDLEMSFTIEVERPVEFELAFRLPAWSTGYECETPGGAEVFAEQYGWPPGNGWLRLQQLWHSGDRITLSLSTEVILRDFRPGERFISYGPLVFARPIESREGIGRDYAPGSVPEAAFADRYYLPVEGDEAPHRLPRNPAFVVLSRAADSENPWQDSIALAGESIPPGTRARVPALFLPMGGTVLRQVTFGTG